MNVGECYRGGFAVLAGDFELRVLVAVVSAEEQVQLARFGVHRQTAHEQRPHLTPIITSINFHSIPLNSIQFINQSYILYNLIPIQIGIELN